MRWVILDRNESRLKVEKTLVGEDVAFGSFDVDLDHARIPYELEDVDRCGVR